MRVAGLRLLERKTVLREYIQRPWRKCRLPELESEQTQGKGMVDQFDDRVEVE